MTTKDDAGAEPERVYTQAEVDAIAREANEPDDAKAVRRMIREEVSAGLDAKLPTALASLFEADPDADPDADRSQDPKGTGGKSLFDQLLGR